MSAGGEGGSSGFDPYQFEMRPPPDMMNEKECLLCVVQFQTDKQRLSHYESVKHAQKETQWVKDTYAQMGIKSDRFLWNPKRLAGKSFSRERRERQLDPARGLRDDELLPGFEKTVGCPQCRLWFESLELRKAHHKTPQHALVIWEIKNRHIRPNNASISATVFQFNDFTCKACDRTVKNGLEWEHHLDSTHHRKLAKRILETGKIEAPPPPVPVSNMNKAIKQEQRKRARLELRARAEEGLAAHTATTLLSLGPGATPPGPRASFFMSGHGGYGGEAQSRSQQVAGFGSGFAGFGGGVDFAANDFSPTKIAQSHSNYAQDAGGSFDFVNDV